MRTNFNNILLRQLIIGINQCTCKEMWLFHGFGEYFSQFGSAYEYISTINHRSRYKATLRITKSAHTKMYYNGSV